MSVGEHCCRMVSVIHPDESVLSAAKLMREHHVGDVVVVEAQPQGNKPVGILTDRDIVLELIAKNIRLEEVTVGDAMSYDLYSLPESMDLLEAVAEMRSRAVRRAPVINDNGFLVGILSIDDVLGILAELLKDLSLLVNKGRRRERALRS